MKSLISVVIFCSALALGNTAEAVNNGGGTAVAACAPFDTGIISVEENIQGFYAYAPEEYLIAEVCVAARSQSEPYYYITMQEPRVLIEHINVENILHYSLRYVPVEPIQEAITPPIPPTLPSTGLDSDMVIFGSLLIFAGVVLLLSTIISTRRNHAL